MVTAARTSSKPLEWLGTPFDGERDGVEVVGRLRMEEEGIGVEDAIRAEELRRSVQVIIALALSIDEALQRTQVPR